MTKEQEFRKLTEEAKFKAFSVMCKKAVDLEKENATLKKELEVFKKNRDEILNEIDILEDRVAELRECY